MITGRKNYFRILFGGSTGKSCKSPGGYYIIKFLANYFSHPVRAPFLRNLCGSGTETGGGALTGQGLLQEKTFGELFSGALHKNPVIAPGQLHKIILPNYFGNHFAVEGTYGGPSEKFVGGFWGNFQKLPPNFSEVAFICRNQQMQRILGQLLRSLLQNPGSSQKLLQKSTLRCIRVFSVLKFGFKISCGACMERFERF